MKYRYIYISIAFLSILQLVNISQIAQAVDQSTIISDQLNTTYPTELITQNPQTQQDANLLIDSYIKKNFDSVYYTERSSIGEIKMIIKNKYLFTRQNIDFTAIKYHIDKSFIFDGALYTWTVKKGDSIIGQISSNNKENFFYNFNESGIYQVEVTVNSNGVIKTGSMTIDVFDKISLDYRPFNPGKGDTIVVVTELPVSQYNIEWKLDGRTVENSSNQLTFVESKGYNQSYNIEAIAKDRFTGFTKYYGVATIEIKEPSIRFSVVNSQDNIPIPYEDNITIDTAQSILISADLDNINQDARLSYVYRINDEIQSSNGNSLLMDIDPNQGYTIDVIVTDESTGDTITNRFTINGGKSLPIEANLSDNSRILAFIQNDRYSGIMILGIIGVLLTVLSIKSRQTL